MALERMDPDHARWYERGVVREHVARYAFAQDAVDGVEDVLDVACGTGYGTRMLAKRAKRVTGVDISSVAVTSAIERAGRVAAFLIGDASDLPFAGSGFDRVCSFETIEHLPERLVPSAIAEFARVLRPGGKLVISTPDRRSYSLGGATGNAFHEIEYTLDEFRALLDPHFEIESICGQKFSRPLSLELAHGVARAAGHDLVSRLWRAYKMVVCRDEAVIELSKWPRRVPMVLVFVARKRAAPTSV